MNASLTYLERDASGPAALRLSPPQREGRTASHFIALTDISDSMADGYKLANVKECLSLLLKFLTPEDEFSLVTFGEDSKVVINRGKVEPSTVGSIERSVQELHTDGCTNLSAGLASVREILDQTRAAGSTLKQGLLVLTDGHANRGEASPAGLRAIVTRIHDLFPGLTFSFVAYGTDHNSGLLKTLAEDTLGSYSIVEDIEGAALTMGEALGGMISCAAQNVVIECPAGTTVAGPHKITPEGRITLGDIYAGTETLLLLELPAGEVAVRGCALPTLDPFREVVTAVRTDTARNVEIDLTRLRYRCSDLFRRLRECTGPGIDVLRVDVAAFKEALEDPAFAGQAALEMLRAEAASLETALERLRNSGPSQRLVTQLMQHEAFTALGRGSSQPIGPAGAPAGAHYYGGSDDEAEDPDVSAGPAARNVSYLSPTVSAPQRNVAIAMRTLSSQTPAARLPRQRPALRVNTAAAAAAPPGAFPASAAPPAPRAGARPPSPTGTEEAAGTPPGSPTPAPPPLGRTSSVSS